MSHRRFCLVLLHSCPDTVHRFLLHETQTSSPLIKGSSAAKDPQIRITPAIADCRYRAPLSPRLRGLTNYIVNPDFCQEGIKLFSTALATVAWQLNCNYRQDKSFLGDLFYNFGTILPSFRPVFLSAFSSLSIPEKNH